MSIFEQVVLGVILAPLILKITIIVLNLIFALPIIILSDLLERITK